MFLKKHNGVFLFVIGKMLFSCERPSYTGLADTYLCTGNEKKV